MRPDYLLVRWIRYITPSTPLLGASAAAPPHIQQELLPAFPWEALTLLPQPSNGKELLSVSGLPLIPSWEQFLGRQLKRSIEHVHLIIATAPLGAAIL